jgi:predicted branched-subunit amino acid permease
MAEPSLSRTYWRGVLDGLPFLLVVIPFAMLFGVLGTEAGLTLAEVMGFSVLIIAGAAQFTALQLMTESTPVMLVLLAALIVNLRMAMYSAALTPYLGPAPLWQRALVAYFNVDQTFALGLAKYETEPEMPLRHKVIYFLGAATPICPTWYFFTLMGVLFGTGIPPGWGFDFALPIAFIAMVAPMLRTAAHVAAAVTAVALALAFAWLPSGLGLFVAGIGAMVVGARAEAWLEARR